MEKILLKNIGTIAIIFGLIVFLSWLIPLFSYPVWYWIQNITGIQKFNGISTQYMFTTIGTIFAFWYSYKRYERDKEITSVDKYLNSNKEIRREIDSIDHDGEKENKKAIYNKALYLWHEEFFLKSKNYISNELWLIIKSWIRKDIGLILNRDMINFGKGEITKDSESDLTLIFEHSILLQSILIFTQEKEKIYIDGINFHQFIFSQIEEWRREAFEDDRWKSFYEDEKSITFNKGIISFIETFKEIKN